MLKVAILDDYQNVSHEFINLKNLSIKKGFKPIFPPINLCSDNAAMIAWAGIEKFKLNLTISSNFLV